MSYDTYIIQIVIEYTENQFTNHTLNTHYYENEIISN